MADVSRFYCSLAHGSKLLVCFILYISALTRTLEERNAGSACILASVVFEETCDTDVLWKRHQAQTLSAHTTAFMTMKLMHDINKHVLSNLCLYLVIMSSES